MSTRNGRKQFICSKRTWRRWLQDVPVEVSTKNGGTNEHSHRVTGKQMQRSQLYFPSSERDCVNQVAWTVVCGPVQIKTGSDFESNVSPKDIYYLEIRPIKQHRKADFWMSLQPIVSRPWYVHSLIRPVNLTLLK